MSVCFLVCLIITCKPFNRFGSEENVRTTAHSCMPSPLAPDPIRVQPCVWCLFWTYRKLHCRNIYLAYPKQSYLHAGSTSKALKVFKMSNYITKKIKAVWIEIDRVVTIKSRIFFSCENFVLSEFFYWFTSGCILAAHSSIHASFILRRGLTRFQLPKFLLRPENIECRKPSDILEWGPGAILIGNITLIAP